MAGNGRTKRSLAAASGGTDELDWNCSAVGHTGYSSAGVSGERGGGVWMRTRFTGLEDLRPAL